MANKELTVKTEDKSTLPDPPLLSDPLSSKITEGDLPDSQAKEAKIAYDQWLKRHELVLKFAKEREAALTKVVSVWFVFSRPQRLTCVNHSSSTIFPRASTL